MNGKVAITTILHVAAGTLSPIYGIKVMFSRYIHTAHALR
jgi:hypothetical protein